MPPKSNNNGNNKLFLNKYEVLKRNPNMCVLNQRKLNQKNNSRPSTVKIIENNNNYYSFEPSL